MSETTMYTAQRGGPGAGKYTQYFSIYDRYFSQWKGKSPRILEIGVAGGTSLELWRQYFGSNAEIIGIDTECTEGFDGWFRLFKGDQGDKEFLRRVISETGGEFDIVIDDGSHRQDHIITSFETLYPHVTRHGIYLVEDLHTAYWVPPCGGTPTFMEYSKALLDELNTLIRSLKVDNVMDGDQVAGVKITYDGTKVSDFSRETLAIHAYESIIIFEKGRPALLNWQYGHRLSSCPAGHRLTTGHICSFCQGK